MVWHGCHAYLSVCWPKGCETPYSAVSDAIISLSEAIYPRRVHIL